VPELREVQAVPEAPGAQAGRPASALALPRRVPVRAAEAMRQPQAAPGAPGALEVQAAQQPEAAEVPEPQLPAEEEAQPPQAVQAAPEAPEAREEEEAPQRAALEVQVVPGAQALRRVEAAVAAQRHRLMRRTRSPPPRCSKRSLLRALYR
jgi:hypothetical protein